MLVYLLAVITKDEKYGRRKISIEKEKVLFTQLAKNFLKCSL